MKNFILKLVKVIVKYILPIVIGYVEGDTHTVQDGISTLF